MSSSTTLRSLLQGPVCSTCRVQLRQQTSRSKRQFASTAIRRQPQNDSPTSAPNTAARQRSRSEDALPELTPGQTASPLRAFLAESSRRDSNTRSSTHKDSTHSSIPVTTSSTTSPTQNSDFLFSDIIPGLKNTSIDSGEGHIPTNPPPHHLHIFAQKHNTHITLTRPSKEPIISLSAGNIGFRKAQRGSYDAAFQLAAYVMRNIQERGLLRAPSFYGRDDDGPVKGVEPPIRRLELVWRGFGHGREAVTKALLGNEGRNLRKLVVGVSDATRLKIGGTRGMNPRRLG